MPVTAVVSRSRVKPCAPQVPASDPAASNLAGGMPTGLTCASNNARRMHGGAENQRMPWSGLCPRQDSSLRPSAPEADPTRPDYLLDAVSTVESPFAG